MANSNRVQLEDLGDAIAETLTVYGKETQEKVKKEKAAALQSRQKERNW